MENLTHDQTDWAALAKHYDIQIATAMRQEQLKNVVVESLVEEGILPEVALQTLTPVGFPPLRVTSELINPATQTTPTVLDADKLFELEKLKL